MNIDLLSALLFVCNNINKDVDGWFPIDEPVILGGSTIIKCFNPYKQEYCYVNCYNGQQITLEEFDDILNIALDN